MKIEFENIVENWSKAQKAGAVLPCPRCGKMKMKDDVCENALSRRADICVCGGCGTEEALEDFGKRKPHQKLVAYKRSPRRGKCHKQK